MSDGDSSTEDLISKQLNVDDNENSSLSDQPPRLRFDDDTSVVIQFPGNKGDGNGSSASSASSFRDFKSWRKTVNLSFLVLAVVLLLIAVIFMCLYFHQKSLLEGLQNKDNKNKVCVTAGCVEAAAFMQSAMDKTIDPCQDFYLYSCAGWIKNNPIPEGESSWDTISIVNKRNERIMKDILEDPRVKSATDLKSQAEYNAYKIFRSCKDMNAINKMGTQPLVSLMNDITNFVPLNSTEQPKHKTLMSLLTTLYDKTLMQLLFSISIGHDDKNSGANILQVIMYCVFLCFRIMYNPRLISRNIIELSVLQNNITILLILMSRY